MRWQRDIHWCALALLFLLPLHRLCLCAWMGLCACDYGLSVLLAEACVTVCQAWAARCPGSSISLAPAPNPLSLPLVQCSGHGACVRTPTDCRADPSGSCVALCQCAAGWDSADCSLTTDQAGELRQSRGKLLQYLVSDVVVFLLPQCLLNCVAWEMYFGSSCTVIYPSSSSLC